MDTPGLFFEFIAQHAYEKRLEMAWEPGTRADSNGYGRIRQALERGISNSVLQASDTPAIELARRYADDIDDGVVDLEKAGPQLTALLVQLRMTPAARLAGVKGGETNVAGTSVLDELKARRARSNRA